MERDRIRSGRLGEERPDEIIRFLSSMEADQWIGEADILVDIAHLLMLLKVNLIGEDAAKAIMQVLLELQKQGLPPEVFEARYEDIHAGIEAYLIHRIGEEYGGRLHTGRSRNDEVATCIKLRLRDELMGLMGDLITLREVLLDSAASHEGTVMPGFTHLQHAQPTTLAHHLLAYEEAFSRDFDRFRDAFGRINRSPLGAAAFASTGVGIDREFTAHLLGFRDISTNTMDAVAARDWLLEVLSACSIMMSSVSRCCEELVLWSSPLIQFIELADPYCSTSSIMPQKKNPDTAEIIRAKAGTVSGAFTAALMCLKGLPMSYNRDLQECTPHLWQGVSASRPSIRLLHGMLSSAVFNTERLHEEADQGFSTATDLADLLVREFQLPFRTAHSIVGRAVRKGHLDLHAIESAAVEIASISLIERGLTDNQIHGALDPTTAVAARNGPGGPAPSAVRAALRERRRIHRRDAAWVEKMASAMATAKDDLLTYANEVVR